MGNELSCAWLYAKLNTQIRKERRRKLAKSGKPVYLVSKEEAQKALREATPLNRVKF